MNATEAVHSTTQPAFAVDREGHILAWNAGAEQLFGHLTSEVLGRLCWEVLGGRDLYGNDYCLKNCQLRSMAWQGRSVHPCEIVFRDAVGQPIQTRVSLLVVRGGVSSDLGLVHLVDPIPSEVGSLMPVDWRVCPADHTGRLTKREMEVLGRLSEGRGTKDIAAELGLSTATIRNYIQHILRKLRVHSRLEAVALARRLGLIG